MGRGKIGSNAVRGSVIGIYTEILYSTIHSNLRSPYLWRVKSPIRAHSPYNKAVNAPLTDVDLQRIDQTICRLRLRIDNGDRDKYAD
jgi:hypothetical protein